VILSIDESIQRLKAEILVQDWRVSPRRLEYLEAAFVCLKNRFKSRKGMLAILAMAEGVVDYLKKRPEEDVAPEVIDFLKETIAHVVSLYEDRDYDPEHEGELYKRVYLRFTTLKQRLQGGREGQPAAMSGGAPAAVKAIPAADDATVNQLLDRLRMLLGRRDGSVVLLHRFLEQVAVAAMSGGALTEANLRSLLDRVAGETDAVPAAGGAAGQPAVAGADKRLVRHEVRDCPPTSVRSLVVGDVRVVIPEGAVALARPLKPGKRASYLQGGRLPLADLAGFLQGLAGQFHGPLAEMKDRQLKKLALPVMTPHGVGLPEMPDEAAEWLVVVSHGNRHGALFCRDFGTEAVVMSRFQKGKNGDISGSAYWESGGQAPFLDVEELLRREGFLSMT